MLMVQGCRPITLGFAALLAVAGTLGAFYDTVTLTLLVCAAGLLWSSREWKACLLAGAMIAGGLFWSSRGFANVSLWWRGRIVYEKMVGHFPYLRWGDVPEEVIASYHSISHPDPEVLERIAYVGEKSANGRKWELFQSEFGTLWLPAPGKNMFAFLLFEMYVQRDYESGEVAIRPGDTVIDCGSHVGVFTKYALRRGAGQVIAIDPNPTNFACWEENLAEEISDHRVVGLNVGVWDKKTRLTLSEVDEQNLGTSSFIWDSPQAKRLPGVLVVPLDEIVEQLHLQRVDFIKMDIEGSERFALRGATQTIKRFRPRMAIAAYHLADDPDEIPRIVKGICPTYRIHAKDVEMYDGRVNPKVLFFR